MSITVQEAQKLEIPDPELLKVDPSQYWKVLVDQFLEGLDQTSQENFQLAAGKFAEKDPHLYIKDIPWFKDWWKDVQNLLRTNNVQKEN